jgi:hypothetical protein
LSKAHILKEKIVSVSCFEASAKLLFNEEAPIGKQILLRMNFMVKAVYKIIKPSAGRT